MNNGNNCKPIVLVCVTDQIKCDRLIYSGRRMADLFALDLKVLSVETSPRYDENAGREIEHLFQTSNRYGAEMTVYYHHDPMISVLSYIKRNNIAHIVVGTPPLPDQSRFVNGLLEAFPQIPITTVSESGDFRLAQSGQYGERLKTATA